jgi:hypothetical protein
MTDEHTLTFPHAGDEFFCSETRVPELREVEGMPAASPRRFALGENLHGDTPQVVSLWDPAMNAAALAGAMNDADACLRYPSAPRLAGDLSRSRALHRRGSTGLYDRHPAETPRLALGNVAMGQEFCHRPVSRQPQRRHYPVPVRLNHITHAVCR